MVPIGGSGTALSKKPTSRPSSTQRLLDGVAHAALAHAGVGDDEHFGGVELARLDAEHGDAADAGDERFRLAMHADLALDPARLDLLSAGRGREDPRLGLVVNVIHSVLYTSTVPRSQRAPCSAAASSTI